MFDKILSSLYKFGLSVCLFVSNKRQNGRTDRAQIFVGPHVTPGKVYKLSKFQKFVLKSFYFCIVYIVSRVPKIQKYIGSLYTVFSVLVVQESKPEPIYCIQGSHSTSE